jgi:hypothetical protein
VPHTCDVLAQQCARTRDARATITRKRRNDAGFRVKGGTRALSSGGFRRFGVNGREWRPPGLPAHAKKYFAEVRGQVRRRGGDDPHEVLAAGARAPALAVAAVAR